MHAKRRTIGIRVPNNAIVSALVTALGEPLLSTTLERPDDSQPLFDPYETRELFGNSLELIIDGGFGPMELTTVVSLLEDVPEVWREGKGDTSLFT